MSSLKKWLSALHSKNGTDLYLTVGAPPTISVDGRHEVIEQSALTTETLEALVKSVLTEPQWAQFLENPEMNVCLSEAGVARYRVNVYRQRGDLAMVVRHILEDIPSRASLDLPEVLEELVLESRGLILFVGGTSSGKSTTLASLIEHRKNQRDGHIVTIEDPIEYVHQHGKSLISQREIGMDTASYDEALKNTLRQAPDVILIGEIRTQETMQHAISFAETGHLCLSTLHANNASQAIDRIIHFFPADKRDQILLDLSFNLRAIISQRLLPGLDGKRTVATEVLLASPLVSDVIRQGRIAELRDLIARSNNLGMHTFDQDLLRLVNEKKISRETALQSADSMNNLRIELDVKGGSNDSDKPSDLRLKE